MNIWGFFCGRMLSKVQVLQLVYMQRYIFTNIHNALYKNLSSNAYFKVTIWYIFFYILNSIVIHLKQKSMRLPCYKGRKDFSIPKPWTNFQNDWILAMICQTGRFLDADNSLIQFPLLCQCPVNRCYQFWADLFLIQLTTDINWTVGMKGDIRFK